jgi:hypothetical protein
MSSPPQIALSNFHSKFSEAVRSYNNRTKNDLLFHPLAPVFQSCNDPAVALSVLQRVSHRSSDEHLKSLLSPTLIGLYSISLSVEEGVGLVIVGSFSFRTCTLIKNISLQILSPEKVILVAIGILLVRTFLNFNMWGHCHTEFF